MSDTIEIIDLFAGPGGLGEGFSAAGRQSDVPMQIRLSVEKDPFAVRTLRLRAFLRTFEHRFPAAYYDSMARGEPLPDWQGSYPSNWAAASSEVRQLTLGAPGVFDELAAVIDEARERTHGRTILIGGPPCQAYSLVGRARNAGTAGYVAEADGRHFLYTEYVRILDRLRPAIFVMENVKGLLSSHVGGGPIFERMVEDLCGAGDGYNLVPLAAASPLGSHDATDFVVRAEQHGIPQARHRVFLVGLRKDITFGRLGKGPLLARAAPLHVSEVIGGMPRLRSGLSSGDNPESWTELMRAWSLQLRADAAVPDAVREAIPAFSRRSDLPRVARSRSGSALRNEIAGWLTDPLLENLTQHEARSHMGGDLGRYLFVSAWGAAVGRSPKISDFPEYLMPDHANRDTGKFADRFRVQLAARPSTTITSHIAKDGHYFIHPDPTQCRSLTVREAARLQTFPDNYWFCGPRTEQYKQVGNAVPPLLARQIGESLAQLLA